uniref:Beta-defensin-like domain-containing protein n=1 Tax=Zonotrichia albicollis TaxID=44394 RepID=A0A8D2M3I6_ZONAL
MWSVTNPWLQPLQALWEHSWETAWLFLNLTLLLSTLCSAVPPVEGDRHLPGNAVLCRRIRGFCSWRSCPRGTSLVGRCSPSLVCCRR